MAGSVLILGAGLMSPPLVHYLAEHGIRVTIASRTVSKAHATINSIPASCSGKSLAKAIAWDVEQPDAMQRLQPLVAEHDIVVSLLPYIYHVRAAEVAIANKKHFCTTSYVSPEMKALEERAKSAGIVMLNECGVDPGLDHMSAMRMIDAAHAKGGKILSFTSVCGGLPAPESNNNPLGYKFSWAPRGVLLASRNAAKLLRDGKVVEYGPGKIYDEGAYINDTVEGQELEWYFNRDSVPYASIYGIPESLTVIRGTYRFRGWCRFLKAISDFGFTSLDPLKHTGISYHDFTLRVIGADAGADARRELAQRLNISESDDILVRLDFLGLFDRTQIVHAPTALDALCALCEKKLQYAPGEKDQIVMKHTFEIEYPSGHRETATSTLISIGMQPTGFSAMARTVALPLAIAIRALLDGRLSSAKYVGLVRPVIPEIYNLILNEMETFGVKFIECVLPQHIWLRHECKLGEERVALVPADVKKLVDAGFRVSVEKSNTRTISEAEYKNIGAHLVEESSWPDAPYSALILGLKELPDSENPLRHRHIFFAHCYKNQAGWQHILSRFHRGGGILYDIEFLTDDAGRRVAAFGRAAGIVGMALGLLQWCAQQTGQPMSTPLVSHDSLDHLVEFVKNALAVAKSRTGRSPLPVVLGALGRCGTGATWFAQQVNVEPAKWDLAETKKGGPFRELLQYDVLVNAIYLSSPIPPFVDFNLLSMSRQLSVVCDVSCDTTNPHNPLPIYTHGTTLFDPVQRIIQASVSQPPVDVIAIDHLPSLIPRYASEEFSNAFAPHLHGLLTEPHSSVWRRAFELFHQKVALLN